MMNRINDAFGVPVVVTRRVEGTRNASTREREFNSTTITCTGRIWGDENGVIPNSDRVTRTRTWAIASRQTIGGVLTTIDIRQGDHIKQDATGAPTWIVSSVRPQVGGLDLLCECTIMRAGAAGEPVGSGS